MPKVNIWISHPQDAWIQAEVVKSEKDSVLVKGPKGEVKLPGDISNYDVVVPESVEKIAENLTDMEVFNEGVILHQIKQRYIGGLIYTFVGNILIALNPYQQLDIYGDELMHKISVATKANRTPSPHVFSIGAAAFHQMINDNLDQSVLISGESGAGKTETTKKVLTYFSTMAGSTASRAGVSVESQILDSNPLLEGFGNAKTVRNNNSSRFGKWMEVNFDSRSAIKGCNIVSYLLEKSRVVNQMPSERNYHSFYMLLAGASKEMRQEFALKPPEQFNYLNQSGCTDIPGRSDAEEYDILVHSMNHLSLDQSTQTQIFQVLAGILHLGNIAFSASRDTEGGSQIASGPECNKIASLLGVSKDSLEQALCFKESTFGIGETITIPLDPPKAADQRDAFSKFIYGKLFDYIVFRVNNILFRGRVARSIGVLDIFGFEVFKMNSFEQLCINYCNERLQSFFNDVIFANERKVYEEEGIDASNITFQDNIPCVRLIDQKNTGIFALLDEEVVVPRGSDAKFVSRLHTTFDESAATKSQYFVRNRRKPNDFGVRHFAGDVMYTVDGFLEKNKDTLSTILINMLKSSSVNIISSMTSLGEGDDSGGSSGVPMPPRKSEVGSGRKSAKSEKLTLASKFKTDLDSLMLSLDSTVPHFIRCVKPNDAQQPNKFDPVLSLRQLKYAGLFEAIHIRKAGYAIRLPLEQFFQRYKHCCICTMKIKKTATVDYVATCRMMLDELAPKIGIENPQTGMPIWVIGKTRVFLRTLKAKYALEECRNGSVDFVALQIQRVMRGCIARSRLYAVRMEQNAAREIDRQKAKEEIKLMAAEDESSMKVEVEYRSNDALLRQMEAEKKKRMREEFERIRKVRYDAATRIQKRFRGRWGRVKAKIFKAEVTMERAISRRSESGLQEAIMLMDALDVKPKHFKTSRQTAKDLLLEVEGEMYVKEQLEEAVEAASDVLLVSAIQLAEDAGMVYLEELRRAKVTLENIRHRREVLNLLRSLLNRCDTLPKLLASTDKLDGYVVTATSLGLGGEYLVQDTVLRCQRLKSLIDMRNAIRYSVEVCSVRRMKSSMDARNKLVNIYGSDLCSEEVAAVMNMMRMLSLAPFGPEEVEDGEEDEICLDDDESKGEKSQLSDSLLPPFVREQLDILHSAKNLAEKAKASDQLKLLVPNEHRLKKYIRVFKWVVSFASWRYGSEAAQLSAPEDPSENGDYNSAAGGLVKGFGYIPSPTRAPANQHQKSARVESGRMTDTKKNISLGSKLYRQRKMKASSGGEDEVSVMTGQELAVDTSKSSIPFSQRQSKSAVAAYQAMKKRNKGNKSTAPSSKAEKMIADTLRDYNKFYQKHKGESGWQA